MGTALTHQSSLSAEASASHQTVTDPRTTNGVLQKQERRPKAALCIPVVGPE